MKYLRAASKNKLKGRALVRLDFNTEDEWRMVAALPTVKLLEKSAQAVIIVSHRGRPENIKVVDGVPQDFDQKLSLEKDAKALTRWLKKPVTFVPHFRFAEIKALAATAPRGSIFLIENLRFLPGEGKNDPVFAKELAALGDYYVNEAFAVCHRAAASVVAVTKYLPSYVGLGLEKEIENLGGVMKRPRRPFVLVVGGAKAEDKLGILHFFEKRADSMLLGGASANTILGLRGVNVAGSKFDADPKDHAMLARLAALKKVISPMDERRDGKGVVLDIGPRTEKFYADIIKKAGTILWSGPMGYFEKKAFAHGNLAIAKAITANRRAFSVTGGGETVMFLKKHKLDKKFSFISTGGGAMLEFLAGEKLPGIEALRKK